MKQPSKTFAEFTSKPKRATHNLTNEELNIFQPTRYNKSKPKPVSEILNGK